jgi:GNAT superfamily N-acetyltransferase
MHDAPPPTFAPAAEADIPALARLMAATFAADFRQHGGRDHRDLAPYTGGELFHTWPFGCTDADRYKILSASEIIGGIVIWQFGPAEYAVGLLFVAPAYQNRGVGRRAWQFLQQAYPGAPRWTVATTPWSERNRHFYAETCGFERLPGAGVEFERARGA